MVTSKTMINRRCYCFSGNRTMFFSLLIHLCVEWDDESFSNKSIWKKLLLRLSLRSIYFSNRFFLFWTNVISYWKISVDVVLSVRIDFHSLIGTTWWRRQRERKRKSIDVLTHIVGHIKIHALHRSSKQSKKNLFLVFLPLFNTISYSEQNASDSPFSYNYPAVFNNSSRSTR